jgi:hypothetical protein
MIMHKKWDNLFWQSPSSDTSTQSEVNTTKNLFKVLKDSGEEVEEAFAELLWEITEAPDSSSVQEITYERESSVFS